MSTFVINLERSVNNEGEKVICLGIHYWSRNNALHLAIINPTVLQLSSTTIALAALLKYQKTLLQIAVGGTVLNAAFTTLKLAGKIYIMNYLT